MEIVDVHKEWMEALSEFTVRCIKHAKEMMEVNGLSADLDKASLQPAAFLCKIMKEEGGKPYVIPALVPFDGFSTEAEKDVIAGLLRTASAMLDVDAVIWISESISWDIDQEKIKEAGHNVNSFVRDKWVFFGYEKRREWATAVECIQVVIDAKCGHKLIVQAFSRNNGKPVWGELKEMEADGATEVGGRFGKFLPRQSRERSS